MFESRWPRVPVLLVTPAIAVAALALAGCGSSSSSSSAAAASAPQSAGVVAQTGPFSAAKLKSALLTRINGATAAIPATDGAYSSLPGVKSAEQSAHSATVQPKACSQVSLTGFNTSAVTSAPAASTTFKVGSNGVSEVLVAPAASQDAAAFGSTLPAQCASYTATIGGKTYKYSVKESSVSGIGQEARVLNVQTAGQPADNVWAIVYRGTGFVGDVTVVGPNASETAARELGQQSYAYAAKSLS
jgi:hypothetical protein